ncbi:MAG TPA: hypothetical protein PLI09_15070 [Candidatus Hydrogenedentes bacterium]|nr:hypothetical protein [Candidatus Hydrogenedentota bacterium]
MLVQCCVCGRVRKGAKWTAYEPPRDMHERISHGYCPTCAAEAFEEIRNYHKSLDYAPGEALTV